jgi:hypothetical protein
LEHLVVACFANSVGLGVLKATFGYFKEAIDNIAATLDNFIAVISKS